MKEHYTKPITSIDEFTTLDIITTSNFNDTQMGDTDNNFGD